MTYPGVLLKANNLYAKKQLGQNFLTDPSVPEMIVRRAGIKKEDTVIEIGPGLGAMTIPLSKVSKKVYAVEADRDLIPLLNAEIIANISDNNNVEVLNKNFLKIDLNELVVPGDTDVTIIGNLPYNISSQILMHLIPTRHMVKKAVFMFQKELAERMVASPGGKDYGRLSVVLQYCATVRKIADIKANQFFPKPKVDSVVVEILFYKTQPFTANNETFLFSVIKAAFGKRRKTLKNALSGSDLKIDGDIIKTALESVNIDPTRRAETLSVEEFVTLCDKLESVS